MAKKGGWAQAAADGINGYIRGMQIRRGMDDADEEKKYREETRNNTRQDREDKVQEKRQLQDAARPVEVIEGANGATLPQTMDNRDVGQPGEAGAAAGGLPAGVRVGGTAYTDPAAASTAATSANTPEAIASRQAAVLRQAGKPMEAAQLESAQVQAQAAKFTLSKGMQDHVNEQFDRKLMTVTSPEQLAGVLSGSPLAGGKELTITKSADGKTFQLMAPGPDGTLVKFGQELEATPQGINKALAKYSASMGAPQKIAALQHFAQYEEGQRQFEENKKLQREQMAESQRHNRAAEGVAGAHLVIARDNQKLAREKYDTDLKNDPMHNMPGAVKLTIGGIDKSLAGIDAAMNKAMAEPGFDKSSEGVKELNARRAQLEGRRNQIVQPYLKAAGVAAPNDYMGYGAKGGTQPAPQTAQGKAIAAAPPGGVTRQGNAYVASQPGAAGGMPQDRLGDAPIGPLTPMADIQEAAAAGNQRAIAYLQRREQGMLENETAPRTAAAMP